MSYIQPIDPSELASRFSTEDTLDPIHSLDEDWVTPRLEKIKSVLDRLPDRENDLIRLYFFLDKKQMDIAEIFGITQAAVSYRIKRALDRIRFLVDMPDLDKHEIYDFMEPIMPTTLDAEIFREMYETTCQSEVANRLEVTQGRVRHRFIKHLRHLGETFLDRCLSWADTLTPGTLEYDEAHKLFRYVEDRLGELDDKNFEEEMVVVSQFLEDLTGDFGQEDLLKFSGIYQVFVRIRYNFNILREVKLPKWSNRAKNTIL